MTARKCLTLLFFTFLMFGLGCTCTEQKCIKKYGLIKGPCPTCPECPECPGVQPQPGPDVIFGPGTGGGSVAWRVNGSPATDSGVTIDPAVRSTCVLRDDFIGVQREFLKFTPATPAGASPQSAVVIHLENAAWALDIEEKSLSANWQILDWYLTKKTVTPHVTCLLRPAGGTFAIPGSVPTPLFELINFTSLQGTSAGSSAVNASQMSLKVLDP